MRLPIRDHAIVQTWLDLLPAESAALAGHVQRVLLNAVPELTQAVKWGNLVFLYRGTHALAIAAHRRHVNLQVFNGASLAPRFVMLQGSGKEMRHLRLPIEVPLDASLVDALARACVALLPERPPRPPSTP